MNISGLRIGGGVNACRRSGMEALRIVAMSMILIHHFLIHAITADNIAGGLFPVWNCLVYAGVNIFFFISGYFTIKFSVRRVVKFLLMVAFFIAVNILILLILRVDFPPRYAIMQLLFPVSGYWFIKVYFLLMLTAPIINAGLQSLSSRGLITSFIILLAGIIYIHSGAASHTYLNGLLLYVAGYAASRLNLASLCSTRKWLIMFVFVTLAMMGIQLGALKVSGHCIDNFINYDNPFNIFAAITISLAFAGISFQSKIVNSLAGASLGCYLLQDGLLGFRWTYGFQRLFFTSHDSSLEVFGFFVLSFILYWAASWILTSFMNLWINNVSDKLTNIIKSSVDRFWNLTLKRCGRPA